jgi:peptidyl-prolyl cis-trans isomerase B (cyclophilin B)
MAFRNQQPENRRSRRQNVTGVSRVDVSQMDLPGPLKLLGNKKLFVGFAAFAGIAMVLGLLLGALQDTTPDGGTQQMNEAPDVPIAQDGTPSPDSAVATPTKSTEVKRYTAPPSIGIDVNRTYRATIQTSRGEMQIELYPSAAPEAVNAFVFLAEEGYYNGTKFMELVKDTDGGRFYAQAGDPTATGLGTPGFSVRKERSELPFSRGAIGMGGTAENSNGGQFFISFGDYPTLTGKYTIFGKVVSGLDVLDSLSLLDLTDRGASGSGDTIQSITISES